MKLSEEELEELVKSSKVLATRINEIIPAETPIISVVLGCLTIVSFTITTGNYTLDQAIYDLRKLCTFNKKSNKPF